MFQSDDDSVTVNISLQEHLKLFGVKSCPNYLSCVHFSHTFFIARFCEYIMHKSVSKRHQGSLLSLCVTLKEPMKFVTLNSA